MTIIYSEIIEIEIQEQKMKNPGVKYLILIKTSKNNKIQIMSSNNEPAIKQTIDLGNFVKEKVNLINSKEFENAEKR